MIVETMRARGGSRGQAGDDSAGSAGSGWEGEPRFWNWKMKRNAVWWTCLLVCFARLSGAAEADAGADRWLEGKTVYPADANLTPPDASLFEFLHVEFIAGQLKVIWKTDREIENATVNLRASADEVGHWPARDWQTFPMTRRGRDWECVLPVDNVDVPLLYFARLERLPHAGETSIVSGRETNTVVSPMRWCRPRGMGAEEPTRIFWPFLDGFEEGNLASWQVISEENGPGLLSIRTQAKTGHGVLEVRVPPKKRSLTLATTRVRGWQIQQERASGLRLWLRAGAGVAKARFTLFSHARDTNQVISPCARLIALTDAWQRIDLPFSDFPGLSLGDVDLLTIEFIADGPRSFFVDDLQFLGPWRLED
jgi:hypothetical protein